jgi:hypothetical protein
MRSPTNRIMTAIAFAEWMSVCIFLIITVLTVAQGRSARGPVDSAERLVLHTVLNVAFMQTHFMSFMLTILLAAWRNAIIL